MYLPVAPCEQGCQVRTQEERVRSREVDIPSATCVNAVNCFLETLAQLHLVDEETVAGALFVPLDDFVIQRVILKQRLVVEVQQIDVDVVGGWVPPSNGGGERLHKLGPTRAAHPRDHLDVPGALERPKPLHVRIAVDPINHQLFLGFKTDKEICARARRRVSPSHVMSAEALDRRHDEVEIALDFPRALFEILMVYATP